MSMSILITGGLGYIGSRLTEWFINNTDYSLTIGDRYIPEASMWPPDRVKIAVLDLFSDDSLSECCRNIDCIIHLAAMNEIDCAKYPEEATRINVIGTQHLLRAAIVSGVRRFIYFSTAHIYGAPLRGVISEETLPRPVHPYSITHKAAEDFVIEAHDRKQLAGIVIRLSNSYGYPAFREINRWTLIVNDLCRQAIMTNKMILKTSGLQKRDFITLEDVCRATHHFIQLSEVSLGDSIFNVGGNNSLSIYEIAKSIAENYHMIYGSYPVIEKPAADPREKVDMLEYRIEKLLNKKFNLIDNSSQEIIETLKRCKLWFG